MNTIRRIRGAIAVVAGLAAAVALAVPASAGAVTGVPAAGAPALAGSGPARSPGAPEAGPARASGSATGPAWSAAPAAASSSWAVQASASGQAYANYLESISCATATSCIAVGYNENGSIERTLAESWNGKQWRVQPTPNPGNTFNILYAVSCTTASACVAVGDFNNGTGHSTLAEVWNGSTWTMQPTPNPTAVSELDGVSRTAPDACEAVGYYEPASGPDAQVTLAEAWNGSTWTAQPTPNLSQGGADHLYGVSCTAAAACAAVGQYSNISGIDLTLAEGEGGA